MYMYVINIIDQNFDLWFHDVYGFTYILYYQSKRLNAWISVLKTLIY
jgi:hypothetical protein